MMKIAKSLAVIVGVVAIAGGATYAWVQTKTITDITYAAGSADLKIDSNPDSGTQVWTDGFNASALNKTKLKPGSFGEQIIDIKNVSDTDGTASIRLQLTANAENDVLSPEIAAGDNAANTGAWDGELAYNMRVKISYDADNNGTFETTGLDYTLAEYNANPNQLDLGAITHNEVINDNSSGIASVKLEWSIPVDASNQIMTDSVGVNVILGLK